MALVGISSFERNRHDTHSIMKDTANSEKHTEKLPRWPEREAGEFWEGPHGYLKKLDDGKVVPVPKRHCSCGKIGQATGDLPRYTCGDPDCIVVSFA